MKFKESVNKFLSGLVNSITSNNLESIHIEHCYNIHIYVFENLNKFPKLEWLWYDIPKSAFPLRAYTETLPQLNLLTQLNTLGLCGTMVDSRSFVQLQSLSNLTILGLRNLSQLNNDGIKYISKLTNLEKLYLRNTQVSSLECLTNLQCLRLFEADYTALTNEGLSHITHLTGLNHFSIGKYFLMLKC